MFGLLALGRIVVGTRQRCQRVVFLLLSTANETPGQRLMSLEHFFDEHLAKHAPKLGIHGISDLLFYLPKKYNDYSRIDTSFEEVASEGRQGLFRLRVKKIFIDTKKKPARAYGYLTDGRQDISMSCFGAIFSWKGVRSGDLIHVQGKVDTFNGNWQVKDAEVVPQFKIGKVF